MYIYFTLVGMLLSLQLLQHAFNHMYLEFSHFQKVTLRKLLIERHFRKALIESNF